MSITFENAKIGDKVWCMAEGWGVVDDIVEYCDFPLRVSFPNDGYEMYTLDGIYDNNHKVQTLFWDEVVIKAPTKPLPALDVDAKVLVWTDPRVKQKRHFSHFDEDGRICVFESGRTSYTRIYRSNSTAWPYWKLAE